MLVNLPLCYAPIPDHMTYYACSHDLLRPQNQTVPEVTSTSISDDYSGA